jgi:hypothetical protein
VPPPPPTHTHTHKSVRAVAESFSTRTRDSSMADAATMRAPLSSFEGRAAAIAAYKSTPIDADSAESLKRCRTLAIYASFPFAAFCGVTAYQILGSVRLPSFGAVAARLPPMRLPLAAGVFGWRWSFDFLSKTGEECWPCYATAMAGQTLAGESMRSAYEAAVVAGQQGAEAPMARPPALPLELQAARIISASRFGGSDGLRLQGGLGRYFTTWMYSERTRAMFEVGGGEGGVRRC